MQTDWRPSAPLEMLQLRARVLAEVRRFFSERGVMEVETPVLSSAGATEPHLYSFRCSHPLPGSGAVEHYYLHTSPELFMKRLIAAGSGPIYQICKAFRKGETGERHNPEFTLVEWYRPGIEHHDLVDEVDDLVRRITGGSYAERIAYADAFRAYLGVDPHEAELERLRELAQPLASESARGVLEDRAMVLDLLFSHRVAPELGQDRGVILFDYPSCQSALASINPGPPAVANRFELFMNGMEIASGYQELTDPVEQRLRFELNNHRRTELGRPAMPLDERFLAALEGGLAECSGVALGLDRLLMVASKANAVQEVISFGFEQV